MEKLRRYEFEYSDLLAHAEVLFRLRQGCVIEKERHIVHYGEDTWQIDVFLSSV